VNSFPREHNVQVTNPDPFAKPVLRSPVQGPRRADAPGATRACRPGA